MQQKQADTNRVDFRHGILDTVAEGLVVVGAEGFIRHINAYAASTLNISPTASTGKHFREVFCPSLPENKCWVNLALRKPEKLRNHRFFVQKSDGSEYAVLANFTPILGTDNKPTGAIVALWPENSAEQLRQEREKQQAILGSLAEGLFTVDNEWQITSFNRAAERITGWSEAEVLGKYCNRVFQCDGCAEKCPIAETLRRSLRAGQRRHDLSRRSRRYHAIGAVASAARFGAR
jgi:PAS domain S-box-containing protein